MRDDSPFALEKTVFDLFSAQVRQTPNALAVRASDGTRSYAQVEEFAFKVASALHADGLEREEPVAVFMQRTADLPAVLLGIMRAGGAYLPIDLQEPPERVSAMVKIAGCRRSIGDRKTFEKLSSGGGPEIKFYDVDAIGSVDLNLPPPPSSTDLAYVIFTSGSTGAPKAVEVEHHSMTNVLVEARNLFEFTSQDTFLGVTTLAFDISVIEFFLPLIVGADILLRDKSTLLKPREIARLVREEGVTAIHTGPSVWSVILDYVPDFPRLRIAVSAGEAVTPSMARTIARYADQAWNMYGPTEATVWATGHLLEHTAAENLIDISAPIGREFHGVSVRIEDEYGNLVSQGVEGELLLGDICVARGYRNRPDLTEERFVLRGDTRFYRTGDRVVRSPAGFLSYKGRFDDQISIQGRRIEPREIEVLLENEAGIAQAAATWFETESRTRAIVAAIVLDGEEQPDLFLVRKHLEAQIPEAMIPAKYLVLDRLPITKNAKVDRAAIRALQGEVAITSLPSVAESNMTATEAIVAEIWGRSMRDPNVGPESNFFEIGGDSLAAVNISLRLEHKLELFLPSQLVFEAPVLRDFAAMVDEIRAKQFVRSDSSFIFPLVERPETTPVFFVGVDLKMAHRWRLPCSLYAVAYWATGGRMVEMETVEQLAATYIESILKLQPQGPYRIAGYSFGALVAFEIAQQLQALGRDVEQLLILDPFKLSRTSSDGTEMVAHHESAASQMSKYGRNSMGRIRRHGLAGLITSLYRPIQMIRGGNWLMYQIFHLHRRYPNLVQESLLPKKLWPVFWYSARRKAGEYIAKPYTGQTLAVFTPKQGGEDAWKKVLKTANFMALSADHGAIFDSDVSEKWETELREMLERQTST
ncbi:MULTISPECIES: amino acid adenylation domain-containing protein [Falsihalocynthiibacter]|uniref:amino acid adenylation domain-containing protein n=1 Tax=Falsihalocynthiibacter TaxID=2854182 RepID=UPI0030028EF7